MLGLLKLGVYPETRISNKTGLQGIVKIGQGSLTNLSVQVLVKTEGFTRTRSLLWFYSRVRAAYFLSENIN